MKLRAHQFASAWDVLNALLIALAIIACIALLTGCASFDYDWQRAHPAAPKPWRTVIVQDVDATCRALHSQGVGIERILGCATWRADGCTIYLPEGAAPWTVAHEQRHCAGWTHL